MTLYEAYCFLASTRNFNLNVKNETTGVMYTTILDQILNFQINIMK